MSKKRKKGDQGKLAKDYKKQRRYLVITPDGYPTIGSDGDGDPEGFSSLLSAEARACRKAENSGGGFVGIYELVSLVYQPIGKLVMEPVEKKKGEK